MILALDTENTFWNKGNPFDQRNFNVCVSYKTETTSGVVFGDVETIKNLVEHASLLVFFNGKYDLHWLRKLGIDCRSKRVWCCQVFEFLHSRQERPYPSLEDAARGYGLGGKLSIIEQQYWSKGINTHEIPPDILAEYAHQDVKLTWDLYHKQKEVQKPHQAKLFSLQMQDLQVLAEMEWNGLYYNVEKSIKKAEELEAEISQIQQQLNLHHSVPNFNWASPDHLSALLYGGEIKQVIKVPNGFYKTGEKAGQPKFSNKELVHHLPRKYRPIRGSELKKQNKWSVEEQYLLRLKGDDALIKGLLKLKELTKLKTTYYLGLPAKHKEMNWEPNMMHGQFNQVVAATGRLSSSNPNLQNQPELADQLFESRYV